MYFITVYGRAALCEFLRGDKITLRGDNVTDIHFIRVYSPDTYYCYPQSEIPIMTKVFVNVGLSLDGYLAPDGMTMENPEYKNWGAKWGAMMAWIINQQSFRENAKLGPGGDTGPVNDMIRSTSEHLGADRCQHYGQANV